GDRLVALGGVVINLAAVVGEFVERGIAVQRLQAAPQLRAAVGLGLGVDLGLLRLGLVGGALLLPFLELGVLGRHILDRARISRRHRGTDALGFHAGRRRIAVDDPAL